MREVEILCHEEAATNPMPSIQVLQKATKNQGKK
jgi:hypothetical protein